MEIQNKVIFFRKYSIFEESLSTLYLPVEGEMEKMQLITTFKLKKAVPKRTGYKCRGHTEEGLASYS